MSGSERDIEVESSDGEKIARVRGYAARRCAIRKRPGKRKQRSGSTPRWLCVVKVNTQSRATQERFCNVQTPQYLMSKRTSSGPMA